MMNQKVITTLLLFTFGNVFGTEFFVSLKGKDSNPGTRQKPFASFQRAQQAARAELASRPGEAVTVTFRGGTYSIDQPLQFTPADSGASRTQPVRYRAQPG